ncbi:uncharacterized protein LOC120120427 [Hibiscus syriacus]|uniref:uncharacterized protein LOC120120427 n=1 Tax=Hibiscus syriacus TaxID=106335 RepID=UPI0019213BC2|nr:uncharacterized protein LOC120120427 [Hibiscus syriacus]
MEKGYVGQSHANDKDVPGLAPIDNVKASEMPFAAEDTSMDSGKVADSMVKAAPKGVDILPVDPASNRRVEGGGRKPRLASQGVANILLKMKAKKKDNMEKIKRLGEVGEKMQAEIVCLLETRVKEIKAQNVMAQFVEEWSYCWNYSCLDNGRIWEELWNQLSNVCSLVGSNIWLVGRDLNVTVKAMESSKYEDWHLTSEMDDLRNCMTDLGLVDHPFFGPVFTWSNKQEEGFLARKLDRVMVNDQWCEAFPNSHVEFQAPGVTDHCMTVVWCTHENLASRPKPFNFFYFWALHHEFKEVVGQSWKAFNKRCFANITEKVAEKMIQLEKQQILNLFGGIPVKRKRNTIRVLVDEGGNKLETFDSIADELVNYFTRQIGYVDDIVQGCTNNLVIDLLGYTLPAGKDKAPGPDGYTVGFFQYAWDIVRVDFIAVVRYFFETSRMLSVFNSTAIALAPKKPNYCKAMDFIPISCCSVFYKTVTKILVSRLVGYLPEMITPNQSAFVRGRNIESNTLLAQELVRGYGRSYISPRCVIKADLQKAFDSLSLKFLLAVLKGLGLPTQFRGWIEACVMDSRFSIVLNGSLVGYFRGRRGVSLDSIVGVKCVLDRFYVMSGLRLNASKTEIYIAGINERQRTLIQETTGFTISCLPVRYLGVPLVPRKLTEKDCASLVEKIKAKQLILPAVVRRVYQLCARFFWKGGDIPTKGARVSCKYLLFAEGSLWVAWVRSYVLKGADFWFIESKDSFSWSVRKILKTREDLQPLFSRITDWSKVNAHWIWQEIRERRVKVEWHRIVWLPTTDKLARMRIEVDDKCRLCEDTPETRSHLFFECSFSKAVWERIARLCNVNRPVGTWDEELIGLLIGSKRNYRQFRGVSRDIDNVVNCIKEVVRVKQCFCLLLLG